MKRILKWSAHNDLQKHKDLINLVEKSFLMTRVRDNTETVKDTTFWDDKRNGIVINSTASLKTSSQIPLSDFKLERVEGSFSVFWNDLTSLEGCPKEIGGSFNCSENRITSLKGIPKPDVIKSEIRYLNGEELRPLFCSHNLLTDLEYSGDYNIIDCENNQLTSLKGCAKNVYNIQCQNNKLTSLEGGPEETFKLNCKGNPLTSLKGAPKIIHDYFECDDFKILSSKWNTKGWIETMEGTSENGINLLLTLLTEKELDDYFKEDPIKIYILDGAPEIKSGVLKRTGIRDFSRIGRSIKTGL